MLRTLIRRAAEGPKPFNFATNPYKAKKIWPPNFDNISQKHQFRLERRYKRRAKLKWARPRWTKGIKLAQNGIIIFVLVYGVLFMDWGREETPFKGIRAWYKGLVDSIWTHSSQSEPAMRNSNPKMLEEAPNNS